MRKIKVGDDLFLAHKHDRGHLCKVTKIGRKYIYVNCNFGIEKAFYREDWREKTDYTSEYKLYRSKQEWEDDKEWHKLWGKLYCIFSSYTYRNNKSFPLEQLRKVDKILDWKLKA